MKALILMSLGSLVVHLMFAAVGFLLSVFVIRSRTIYPLTIGIALASYFVELLANSNDSAKWMTWFSFFSYPNVDEAAKGGQVMEPTYLIVSLLVIVGGFAAALVTYRRKDIAA